MALKAKCPHERIEHCPLYVALHGVTEHGTKDYHRAVAKLRQAWPGFVARADEIAAAWAARRQRERNMRAAGVH